MSTSSPAVDSSRAEAPFPWLSMVLVAVAAFVSAEAVVYAVRAGWLDTAIFATAWGRWSAAFPGPVLLPVTAAVVLLMGIWFSRVADAIKRGWRATLVTHHSKDALNDLLREILKALSLIGTAMALAPLAHVLWTRILNYDAQDPAWPDRDRFILSAGQTIRNNP